MGKKIIVFADGTGNAYTTQESNIWRLYQALDLSGPDQIAYYIEGVGTSGIRLFAMIDGATGLGVPANVRKLYRFICWNWEPGDEIYVFGFSRGAFTVRCLVGLIRSQGLVPAKIEGDPVSHAEMQRNAMAAWRDYRRRTTPWSQSLPTIWIARAIRDGFLWLYHLGRHRGYVTVRRETLRQRRRLDVRIKFLGLFDTVEAYGVPIEELRRAVDWAIWPLSFRNRVLSKKVERVRHALSLDDERSTFQPLRFDMTDEKTGPAQRIKEVWFAGVHSDVGGGYPDDALAHVPLAWMAEAAEFATTDAAGVRTPTGLRFKLGTLEAFRARASAFGACHDSRAGLAVLYRYDPRVIADDEASGGVPVIHYSVAEKMVSGWENYAPITLPSSARVLLPDGSTHEIEGFSDETRVKAKGRISPEREKKMPSAIAAVEALREPDPAIVAFTRDAIWWRRVAYFVLVFFFIVLACLPLTAPWISEFALAAGATIANSLGLGKEYQPLASGLENWNSGFGTVLRTLAGVVAAFLPAFARPWTDAVANWPLASCVVGVAAIGAYSWNSSLRDRIAERTRLAWFSGVRDLAANAELVAKVDAGWTMRFARRMRESFVAGWVYRFTTGFVLPGLALGVCLLAALVTLSRATVSYRSGQGAFCPESPAHAAPGEDAQFTTDKLCWASGRKLEKGRHYTVRMEVTEPFFDPAAMTGGAGFLDRSFRYLAGLATRRSWSEDWFQPIGRIGKAGAAEWPLEEIDGSKAGSLAELEKVGPPAAPLGACDKVPESDIASVKDIWMKQKGRKTYISQFVAQADGEFFLYVNDALAAIPFGPTIDCFYANNSGKATIRIEPVPIPEDETTRFSRVR